MLLTRDGRIATLTCVGKMKGIEGQSTDLGFPDVYMACDVYYLENVKQWFQEAANVSDVEIVIAVPKGSTKVKQLADLVQPGLEPGGLFRRKGLVFFGCHGFSINKRDGLESMLCFNNTDGQFFSFRLDPGQDFLVPLGKFFLNGDTPVLECLFFKRLWQVNFQGLDKLRHPPGEKAG